MVTGHVDGGITAGWPVAVARDDIALFRRTFRASRARRDLHKPKPVRSGVTTLVQTDRELATGWPVVLACSGTAVFAWASATEPFWPRA